MLVDSLAGHWKWEMMMSQESALMKDWQNVVRSVERKELCFHGSKEGRSAYLMDNPVTRDSMETMTILWA